MATNFGTKIAISWFCVNDSDYAIGYGGSLSGRPTECTYCRYPAPKGRCHGNHFTKRVVWSVGWSVTLLSPAKTAESMEMPFRLRSQVGPGNHELDGVQIPHGKGQFSGGGGVP